MAFRRGPRFGTTQPVTPFTFNRPAPPPAKAPTGTKGKAETMAKSNQRDRDRDGRRAIQTQPITAADTQQGQQGTARTPPIVSGPPPGQGAAAQAAGSMRNTGLTPNASVGMGGDVLTNLDFSGDPYTGFAGQYSPVTAPQILYGDEGAGVLARDILAQMGFTNPAAGALPMLEGYMENFFPLAFLNAGGQDFTNEAAFNFAGDMGRRGLTPGGVGVDSAAMMNALLAGINDPTSPIYQFIAGPGMTPEEQQGNLAWLLAAATSGLNPIAQQMHLAPLDNAMTQYQQGLAHGDIAGTGGLPFLDYLMQNQAIPLAGR